MFNGALQVKEQEGYMIRAADNKKQTMQVHLHQRRHAAAATSVRAQLLRAFTCHCTAAAPWHS